MPKKICPNGHLYDTSIYGEDCPMCPKGDNANSFGAAPSMEAGGTKVTPPGGGNHTGVGAQQQFSGVDAAGDTVMKQNASDFSSNARPAGPIGGATVIRSPKGNASVGSGRKLVGFLVTYNRNPQGKAYELYEGKNYIGRDRSCDISVPEDSQMSGRHMSILYRNVDNKFKYRDEQSSNGTFVNKELSDEGELQNFDIIRLGNTVFIFMAIPQFG